MYQAEISLITFRFSLTRSWRSETLRNCPLLRIPTAFETTARTVNKTLNCMVTAYFHTMFLFKVFPQLHDIETIYLPTQYKAFKLTPRTAALFCFSDNIMQHRLKMNKI